MSVAKLLLFIFITSGSLTLNMRAEANINLMNMQHSYNLTTELCITKTSRNSEQGHQSKDVCRPSQFLSRLAAKFCLKTRDGLPAWINHALGMPKWYTVTKLLLFIFITSGTMTLNMRAEANINLMNMQHSYNLTHLI